MKYYAVVRYFDKWGPSVMRMKTLALFPDASSAIRAMRRLKRSMEKQGQWLESLDLSAVSGHKGPAGGSFTDMDWLPMPKGMRNLERNRHEGW